MSAHYTSYPDEPGYRNTDTSIAAAQAVASSAGRLQKVALAALRDVGGRGLTSQELADRTGIDFASIQPRTSELRRKGMIRDSGERRRNRNGKQAIVWVAGGGS
jgi:DNA-binding IclR family transcriptional regulator